MKPLESAIAVVDGDDSVKATACGPLPFYGAPQGRGGLVQRRVPGDWLPSRIGIAFRAGAAERPCQPFRVVDELWCGTALCTERLAGGVCRIRLEAGKAAILDDRDRAASCYAKRAIRVKALQAGMIGHGVPLPYKDYASVSAARRANCLRKRGTAKSTKARTLGTERRPSGVTTLTGKGACSSELSMISSRPSRTCSAT